MENQQLPQNPVSQSIQNTIHDESNEPRTMLIVILLMYIPIIGIILMWIFMKKWPLWAKLIMTLPLFIGILAVILALVLVGINPSKQFDRANNTKRTLDATQIASALNQYRQDYGSFPPGITSEPQEISSTGLNLCVNLVPAYIVSLPVDPLNSKLSDISDCTVTYNTYYTVAINPMTNQITVSAPQAKGETISITK